MSSGVVPPHVSLRRDQLLEQLIVSLTARGKEPLQLSNRSLDEPTVALLDAWATVGDVLGFYLDRIADESYLSSAVDPGSLLALAATVGHRPRLGVAAHVHLAYALNVDPDDKPVLLAPGLLAQSVPAQGGQPQTFESTDALLARPSWNRLSAKRTEPLKLSKPERAADLANLVVNGATANLAPGDTILLDLANAPIPALLRVAGATVDPAANVTTVALQTASPHKEPEPRHPRDVTKAIDGLLNSLSPERSPVPNSVNELQRTAQSVFTRESDAVPRLLSALRPELGDALYDALGRTPVGKTTVSGASVLGVKAAPFGAQAPPRQLFDERGQPAGSEDWPIGDTLRLTFRMTDRHFGTVLDRTLSTMDRLNRPVGSRLPAIAARLAGRGEATSTEDPLLELGADLGTLSDKAMIELTESMPPDVPLGDLGDVKFGTDAGALTLTYEGVKDSRAKPLGINASVDADSGAIALRLDSGDDKYLWDPNVRAPIRVQLGTRRLSIAWSTTPPGDEVLTLSLETPLPLKSEERTVLHLDSVYSEVLPGDWIVIDRATPDGTPRDSEITYPVIARVQSAETLAASGFGLTAHVTRVTLPPDTPWLGDTDVLQTSLREISVRAQPKSLDLAPVPVSHDVGDAEIELDRLIAGMEAGRLIIVRGIRSDLPAQAGVKSGELAMVKGVVTRAEPGETAHSVLQLVPPLAYRYKRDSVEIFGNVVPARQGATISEVLGSGQPTLPHQTFTLSSAPLLSEPGTGPGGARSTLTVEVGGVGYREVERFAPDGDPRSFRTGTDPLGHTTIVFAAPLPAGNENVKAAYRAGDGGVGNVQPDQVTQLLSRPAGVAGVTNPLPAVGGLPGDGPEAVRAAIPLGLSGLGRVVTLNDYADYARGWSAVGKAAAQVMTGDRQEKVLVTIAGADAAPLDPAGALCTSIAGALSEVADPAVPVVVAPADLWVIVLEARVTRDPLISWDDTVADVKSALLRAFGYEQRELGADVAVGDLIAAAHQAPSVRSFRVAALGLVPVTATADKLARALPAMLGSPVVDVLRVSEAAATWGVSSSPGGVTPPAVSYLTDAVPDSLILIESPA